MTAAGRRRQQHGYLLSGKQTFSFLFYFFKIFFIYLREGAELGGEGEAGFPQAETPM